MSRIKGQGPTTYIAARTGANRGQVSRFVKQHGLAEVAAARPGPCPLSVPVSGKINGRSWREHLDFNESAELMRHLGTAATIILLYLTGMRPQEVQGLRSGCCPDPEPAADGAEARHLIRSHHYKNVTDDDGNHISAGEVRKVPWVAITPVVHAIRVLERMVPEGELLLGAAHHGFRCGNSNAGALKSDTLTLRIESFVNWVNREAKAQSLSGQTIPDDPHGAIGLSRFRRSLAWHVARRPGGLIALAIQYGHMRTLLDARTSSGYGARRRHGIHAVLDVETALAAADTAARLRDSVAAGEKVSGPAARRALTAAAHVPRFEGRIVPRTFARKAAAFLAPDGIVLYDNPDAFLICAFKHDNALCEPEPGATAPWQYDCRPGCGNTVRTDTHARQLRERADKLDQLAAHAPGPVSKRLRANASRLRETADTHDNTAHPAEART
ncbi:integrase [Streptomyces cyaneofuscatus]|uniref:integrase n=1 Tax=Streptomyces cyaneofuscatus TaxID=66883 RepID=UPI00378A3B60